MILKSWQNARPGWTRRVRFYPSDKGDGMARLVFEERDADNTHRVKHTVMVDLVTAEKLYRLYQDETLEMSGRDLFFEVKLMGELEPGA